MRVQVLIGRRDDDRSDAFDRDLASPGRLARCGDPACGRDLVRTGAVVRPLADVWVMTAWHRDAFEESVRQLAADFSPAPDGMTLAARIGREIPWEYDYRDDGIVNAAAGLPSPGEISPHVDREADAPPPTSGD